MKRWAQNEKWKLDQTLGEDPPDALEIHVGRSDVAERGRKFFGKSLLIKRSQSPRVEEYMAMIFHPRQNAGPYLFHPVSKQALHRVLELTCVGAHASGGLLVPNDQSHVTLDNFKGICEGIFLLRIALRLKTYCSAHCPGLATSKMACPS